MTLPRRPSGSHERSSRGDQTVHAGPAVVDGPLDLPPPLAPLQRRPFDSSWCFVADADEDLKRVVESLLCLADGLIGTRGVLEEDHEPSVCPVAAEGLYEPTAGVGERLMQLPSWCALPLFAGLPSGSRTLDLRDGLLIREAAVDYASLYTTRFACAARPGTVVLMAELDAVLLAEEDCAPLTSLREFRSPLGGGAVVAAGTTVRRTTGRDGNSLALERIATHVVSPIQIPHRNSATRELAEATRLGAADLLIEQRAAWAQRWAAADIEAVGDSEATLSTRFALFHILSSAKRRVEAAVGARGLTGPAYAGHVFWDTDAFILPVLAAVDRKAARAVLEYRIRRLGAAQDRAGREGRCGARFPWESAHTGADVTPHSGVDHQGDTVPIRTGELEEHVTADVAWAAWRFAAWSGSWSFLAGAGRPLVVETARYWASRTRLDADGRAHIDSVIGPDEYHEDVDDNAFTNLMARWNLTRAADLVDRTGAIGGEAEEADAWRGMAEALVDNHDSVTGLYEQFAGYGHLEAIKATDLGTPPFAADLILGQERTARSQIIKQADVLMAHFLIPEGVAAGSLEANLDYYLARTAHGSSLSPAVHAALLARAGRYSEALAMFRLAASIDLEDLTESTAGGLHLANLGSMWQAMVHGFAGLSVIGPDDVALSIEPSLPEEWEELRVRVQWHGRQVQLLCRPDAVYVGCDRPMLATVHGSTARVEPPGRWVG